MRRALSRGGHVERYVDIDCLIRAAAAARVALTLLRHYAMPTLLRRRPLFNTIRPLQFYARHGQEAGADAHMPRHTRCFYADARATPPLSSTTLRHAAAPYAAMPCRYYHIIYYDMAR